MSERSSNLRVSRIMRWLLMAGVSYMFATLAVLCGLALLPEEKQVSLSEAFVGWVVLGLAALLFTLTAARLRGRNRS